MAATYKDIQRVTGLSLATISKYFNGGVVRPENRTLIEEATRQLDYQVNAYARGLKSRRSHLIGGLVPELDSAFNARIMADAAACLRAHGYGLIICDSRLDAEKERDSIDFLLSHMVDGILTIPFDKTGKQLEPARSRGVPVVLLDRLATDFPTDAVILDNARASELAVEACVRRGHSKIALLNGPASLYTMRERQAGFERTLMKLGISVVQEWILEGPITMEAGYQNARRLMALGEERPTALFCANYEITLGAVVALQEMGLRIPGDLSLVGFDDLPLTRLASPLLSLIMQPMEDLAREAVDLLIGRVEGTLQGEARIRRMQPELIPGESIGRL